MLHKKVQTLHIWFTTQNKLRGTTLSHKWKFLILLMTRSTCIVTEAISRVLITSCAVIWLLDPKKGGMFRVTPSGSRSSIVKPLSAIMVSLLSNSNLRKPLRSTILWLEMFPLYSWLLKVIAPLGEIPTRPFRITWFLLELNSLEFNRRLEGIWHLISVQSIITRVEEYFSLKLSSIVALITSLLGHIDTWQNFKYMQFMQERNVLLTFDREIPNKWARCFFANPLLSLHRKRKNSSLGS